MEGVQATIDSVRLNLCCVLCFSDQSQGELLKDKDSSNINNPAYSQPFCTALQIAFVDLLHSFKISPIAAVGHSSGEIAAA